MAHAAYVSMELASLLLQVLKRAAVYTEIKEENFKKFLIYIADGPSLK
jgi:Lhr-like helicase